MLGQLLGWAWTLRVNGLASGQHLHKLPDPPGSGPDLLRAPDPIDDGVPVRTRERLKHRLSTGFGRQCPRQVLWNHCATLTGVGGPPSTIRLRPPNFVIP